MPFCCEKCGRPFRDNYNLKKHQARKTVCVFTQPIHVPIPVPVIKPVIKPVSDTFNYIYLLQEREFIKTGENIFKIGKSKQSNNKRFNSYPKGSILLFQIMCIDCDTTETDLIKLFDTSFIKCKNIGNEYYKGNFNEMIKCIFNCVTN